MTRSARFQCRAGALCAGWLIALHGGAAFAYTSDRTLAEYHHTGWTAKNGALGEIVALAQSIDGYLWLGTATGLFRFDGVSFERYETSPGEGFPSSNVSSLLALPSGELFVGFRFGGASLLKDGKVIRYSEREGLPAGAVYAFSRDHEGIVWAATLGGLARLEGSRWRQIGAGWNYPGNRARNLFLDQQGALWVDSGDTLVFLPKGGRRFVDTGERINQLVMAQSPGGSLLLSDEIHGLRLSTGQPGKVPHRSRPWVIRANVQGMIFDREGSLWIASIGKGVQRIPFVDRQAERRIGHSGRVPQIFTRKDDLTTDFATSIFEDREGNIWVGTRAGLDRFRKSNIVRVVFPEYSLQPALVAGEQGAVWIGSLDRPLMKFRDGVAVTHPVPSAITCAYRDNDGTIWLGGPHALWHSAGTRFVRTSLPDGVGDGDVQSIVKDRAGGVWVSIVRAGLYRLLNGVWTHLGNQRALPAINPMASTTDATGRTWFGYPEGRIALLDGNEVRHFSSDDGLQVGNVSAIHSRGPNVWVGGEFGLALFDGNRFRSITAVGGEVFRGVSGIVETAAGELWLSGSFGIARIASAELQQILPVPAYRPSYQLFDFFDGLPGMPQQHRPLPSVVEGTDGRLWFSTIDSLVWIDPTNIFRNTLVPPVVISAIRSSGMRLAVTEDLRLQSGAQNIQIAYTALSLTIPERIRFRYRLEGVDKDWQDVGARREAFYNSLGPGHYRFRVIAANNDGVWNETGAGFSFAVPPTFFQTMWFTILCVLLGLWALWLLYLLRLRQIRERLQGRLQERLAERERIARDLHDTLLQGVQGLILRFQAVAQRIPPAEPARALMEKTLERADEVLVEGRDRVRDLRESTTVSGNLPEALAAAGREFALDHPAGFSMIVQGAERPLHPIVCEEAYRIGREALANAFAHARAQQIAVEVAFDRREFRIRVRDDGQGIDAATLEAGGRPGHWGLSGMRERAHKIGARLTIWSGAGAGTELELKVPAATAYRSPSVVSRRLRLPRAVNAG